MQEYLARNCIAHAFNKISSIFFLFPRMNEQDKNESYMTLTEYLVECMSYLEKFF